MMFYFMILVLAGVASVQGRNLSNPILSDKPYSYPGAIKVDGTYYIISMTYSSSPSSQFLIHSSTDLVNWTEEGYVFEGDNMPTWPANILWWPEIHKVNDYYIIYYGALDSKTSSYAVGAAIGSHPRGPYLPINEPIVPVWLGGIYSPTIINDEDTLHLVWTNDFSIFSRQLSSFGLVFASFQVKTLLDSTLDWEGGYLRTPWYLRRGDFHYLFYTGSSSCNDMAVGVARSRHAQGPYEKLPSPILVNNGKFNCTIGGSVVKDLDDENDVIVFTAYKTDDVDQVWNILLASISWNDEGWPYVEDF